MSRKHHRGYQGLIVFLSILIFLLPAQGSPQESGHPGGRFELSPRQKAEWLLSRKHYPKALDAFHALLERDEADSRVFRGLVQAYRGAGREGEAEASIKEYLSAHPEASAAQYGLGYHYYLEGNDSLAQHHLQRAIQIDPQNALAWNNLGAALAHTKSYTYAIEKVKEAIRLEPKNSMYYNNLGAIYREKGNYGLFFAEFKAYVKEGQSLLARGYGKSIGKTLRQEGFKLYAQGELDAAISRFSRMAEIFQEIEYRKGLVPAYFSLALLYEEKGDMKKAESYFRAVLKINPNHLQAREKVK